MSVNLKQVLVRAWFGVAIPGLSAAAADFYGVQPAALDQPRINAYLRLPGQADPQSFEGTINVQAFFDTGASGILLSMNTAGYLGINEATWFNPATQEFEPIIYSDIGVGGSDDFYVSNPIHIGLARYHPDVTGETTADYSEHLVNGVPRVYRSQIGPIGIVDPNPLLENLDVFGTPLMEGKVVVMDSRPVNTFLDTMRTYIYDPGTPYRPSTASSDPGIPGAGQLSHHVRVTQASFERFTETTPGQDAPTIGTNPFIGPNPLSKLDPAIPAGDVPPIVAEFNGASVGGSWLFDTGAAASMISLDIAEGLDVFYADGTYKSDNPILVDANGDVIPNQFQISVGGIGGTVKAAGFYLTTLTLPTVEGDPIIFHEAPVLVSDITVFDPVANKSLTLDGIFGMNFLVASAFVTESGSFPILGEMQSGKFDWIVYDHDAGTIGLKPAPVVPQDSALWYGDTTGDPSTWDTTSDHWFHSDPAYRYQDGDYIRFDDTDFSMFGAYASPHVIITSDVAPGHVYFDNSARDYLFTGAAIAGYTGITKYGDGVVRFENSNTFRGILDIEGGRVEFAAPQDIGPVNVLAGSALVMETAQRLEALNIDGGDASMTSSDSLLVLKDLVIKGDGDLDLGDNHAVIHVTPTAPDSAAQVATRIGQYIDLARNDPAGEWLGRGLGSSLLNSSSDYTLAVILNDLGGGALVTSSFHGEPVDAHSVLIAYAPIGDLNLDGVLNGEDYFLIDSGYFSGQAGYGRGDLDYSGSVDGDDYFELDRRYIAGLFQAAPGAAAVPEPGTALLALVAGLGLFRRRR